VIFVAPTGTVEDDPPGRRLASLAVTLAHEIGQANGLGDSTEDPEEPDHNKRVAVMNGTGPPEDAFRSGFYLPAPDDVTGLLKIYGHGEVIPALTCENQPFRLLAGRRNSILRKRNRIDVAVIPRYYDLTSCVKSVQYEIAGTRLKSRVIRFAARRGNDWRLWLRRAREPVTLRARLTFQNGQTRDLELPDYATQ
jgi:hypothetical protein